jgi:hypothetical protein
MFTVPNVGAPQTRSPHRKFRARGVWFGRWEAGTRG